LFKKIFPSQTEKLAKKMNIYLEEEEEKITFLIIMRIVIIFLLEMRSSRNFSTRREKTFFHHVFNLYSLRVIMIILDISVIK